MQTKNSIKKSIKTFYSNLGVKKVDSFISDLFFYELKVPSTLLDKDEITIETQNRPIQ